MGKLIVVENDKVEGKDKHNVEGSATPPPPGATYTGVGDFDYEGKMTGELSDFVSIKGKPVALKNSKSALNPGEDAPPAGKHSGPMGGNFVPPSPAPVLISLSIDAGDQPIGEGKPSENSGSSFVKVNGVEVLLDGDKIDTCDGEGNSMNSAVTAENQDFVSCSA